VNVPASLVLVGVIAFSIARALVQPEEPWFRWGPPLGLMVIFAGTAKANIYALIAGGTCFMVTIALDRLWRYRNDAGSFFF